MGYVDEYRDMWELADEVKRINEEIREGLQEVEDE